jgi:hypothetical protein
LRIDAACEKAQSRHAIQTQSLKSLWLNPQNPKRFQSPAAKRVVVNPASAVNPAVAANPASVANPAAAETRLVARAANVRACWRAMRFAFRVIAQKAAPALIPLAAAAR